MLERVRHYKRDGCRLPLSKHETMQHRFYPHVCLRVLCVHTLRFKPSYISSTAIGTFQTVFIRDGILHLSRCFANYMLEQAIAVVVVVVYIAVTFNVTAMLI